MLQESEYHETFIKNTSGECPICYEKSELITFDCHETHVMCEDCFVKTYENKTHLNCVFCRKAIKKRKIIKFGVYDTVKKSLFDKFKGLNIWDFF